MPKSFKKESLKIALPVALLLMLAGVVLLLVNGYYALRAQPQPAEMAAYAPGDLNGRYVRTQVSAVVDEYAFMEQEGEEDGQAVTLGREYMFYTPDGDFVMGLLVEGEPLLQMEEALDELVKEGEAATPLEVSGTVVPMDQESAEMFDELLHYHSISEANAVHSLLVVDKRGLLSPGMVILLFAGAVLLLAAGILLLAAAKKGLFQREIWGFAHRQNEPDRLLAEIEAGYRTVYRTGRVWFYPFAVLYQKGLVTRVIPAEQLEGVDVTKNKTALVLATTSRGEYIIRVRGEDPQRALEKLKAQYPSLRKRGIKTKEDGFDKPERS